MNNLKYISFSTLHILKFYLNKTRSSNISHIKDNFISIKLIIHKIMLVTIFFFSIVLNLTVELKSYFRKGLKIKSVYGCFF